MKTTRVELAANETGSTGVLVFLKHRYPPTDREIEQFELRLSPDTARWLADDLRKKANAVDNRQSTE